MTSFNKNYGENEVDKMIEIDEGDEGPDPGREIAQELDSKDSTMIEGEGRIDPVRIGIEKIVVDVIEVEETITMTIEVEIGIMKTDTERTDITKIGIEKIVVETKEVVKMKISIKVVIHTNANITDPIQETKKVDLDSLISHSAVEVEAGVEVEEGTISCLENVWLIMPTLNKANT